ncbi:hypothetical protein BDN70DRAFT_937301 [Pholiota conissans]|uniref:Uncharacterized protein n=1 Tax=Pholiota conissans TaxID=109636 RepID=A0A9P6CUX2_9AGAR|nr:hypothetical protein BDN70DRAFT_937301 [Pholiota conissans]
MACYSSDSDSSSDLLLLTPPQTVLELELYTNTPSSVQAVVESPCNGPSRRRRHHSSPFKLNSSSMFRSPYPSRTSSLKRAGAGDFNPSKRDTELRLLAQRYRAEMKIAIAKESRKSLDAEERGAAQHIIESDILLEIVKEGAADNKGTLSPRTALRLARAVRNTLTSEETIARLKLQEAKMLIRNLEDDLEEASARVYEANSQVGYLLEYFTRSGVYIPLQIWDETCETTDKATTIPSLLDIDFSDCLPASELLDDSGSNNDREARNEDNGNDDNDNMEQGSILSG